MSPGRIPPRLAVGAIALAVAGASPARADELELLTPIPGGPSFRAQIEARLTALGQTFDTHLRTLTLDTVQFELDGHTRRARLRLAGEAGGLSLALESNVRFRHGAAAVDTSLRLAIAGHALRLQLPDFEVVPRSYLGERYVELRVPVLQGSF